MLYIAYEESNPQKDIRVKKYTEASGISDATSDVPLNYGTGTGSDHHVKLVSDNINLYAVWNEKNADGKTQVRAKRYDGTNWTSIDGGGNTGLNYNPMQNANISSISYNNGKVYVSWSEGNGTPFEQMRIKRFDPVTSTWSFADDNALSDGSGFSYGLNIYPEEYGAYQSYTTVYNNELYLFWKENNKLYVKKYDSDWNILDNAADLSNLQVNNGSLYPAFSPNIKNYVVLVNNDITEVTVTPTVVEPNATITVNGINVSSGEPSQNISLEVSSNDVVTCSGSGFNQ